MDEKQFKKLKIVLIAFIFLEVAIIILYPAMNTHVDVITVQKIETWGDKLYHVRVTRTRLHLGTDEMILNVSRYYYDDLLNGHTYRIKWFDGILIDRILKIEEVS